MRFGIDVQGLQHAQKLLDKVSGPEGRDAMAKALTDTGFKLRTTMQQEIDSVFDRPTPYIRKSVYVEKASPEKMYVEVQPTYFGGKGVDPQKILQAQEFGGPRRDKRSEVALRRIGVLPAGYQTAIPSTPYPGSDDGRGNLKGGFLVQLMAWFQAFGEQGYRSNLRAAGKRRVMRGNKRSSGRRYFVAYGRMRSGRTQHLAPGIYAASGLHSVDVRPVLMFVRAGSYSKRISMERVARNAQATEYLARRVRYRLRQALGE